MSNEESGFTINDDLKLDETNYPQQDTQPKPPLPGNYRVKVTSWKFKVDQDGERVLYPKDNPTYPVISLQGIEITDPFENARKVMVFQDVFTQPFDREGKKASAAADLLRSIDPNVTANNTGEVINALEERLSAGAEMAVRIDYEGYDKDAAKTLLDALGAGATKIAINKAYKLAKVKGYKNIRTANVKAGQGTLPWHKWVGPSGNVITVQPRISTFYPANDVPTSFGPDKAVQA